MKKQARKSTWGKGGKVMKRGEDGRFIKNWENALVGAAAVLHIRSPLCALGSYMRQWELIHWTGPLQYFCIYYGWSLNWGQRSAWMWCINFARTYSFARLSTNTRVSIRCTSAPSESSILLAISLLASRNFEHQLLNTIRSTYLRAKSPNRSFPRPHGGRSFNTSGRKSRTEILSSMW